MATKTNPDDQIDAAIADALPELLVTQWVLMVEVIHPEGEHELIRMVSPESTKWAIEGLLSYGAEMDWEDDWSDTDDSGP